MERRTDTLSRIDEILRPVEDLENWIRDRIFNRHLESRVAVGNMTTFRETPRDSLHPLGEILGKVQPQRELSLASSFAPCPPSSSRPHRSQIPVRSKNYRERGQFLYRRSKESEYQTFKPFRLLISCCVRDKPSNQSLHIAKTH